MQENQPDLLTGNDTMAEAPARKKLLPLWIKIFSWIFLIISFAVPIVLVLGVLGYKAELALYGFETDEAFSAIGILILILFMLKGITAFGLLKEKDWAIKAGIADAVIGIAVCAFVMIYALTNAGNHFSLRLELVALIPCLVKLIKIKPQWESWSKV